ncbi:DUF4355 domain-containing protein [Clostridium nigeriense]|uniref:DUF4355 domain-containing protein n=1 Tax=Clostridium nigeriense TaxID=1805470 RepID=UPI00082CC29D|nr:DUF4355 domain-containing protein [Clostridium nigeriense]
MKKSELLELLKDIEDNRDINETILGIEDFAKSSEFDVSKVTLEDFKNLLANNKEIKGYYTSTLDAKVSKGINTFKENSLPSIIEEELKKASNKDKTPEQIALEELQAKFNALEKEKARAELSNKYTKYLSEKGLSSDLVDFVLNDDEQVIESNISKLEKILQGSVETKVKERIGDNTYTPPANNKVTGVTWDDYLNNPTPENYQKYIEAK